MSVRRLLIAVSEILEKYPVSMLTTSKGSRRLITYQRIPDSEIVAGTVREQRAKENGVNADDLNPFRKGYFKGFKSAFR